MSRGRRTRVTVILPDGPYPCYFGCGRTLARKFNRNAMAVLMRTADWHLFRQKNSAYCSALKKRCASVRISENPNGGRHHEIPQEAGSDRSASVVQEWRSSGGWLHRYMRRVWGENPGR